MKANHFECKFCNAKFVREDRYIAHKCKQMLREEELQTTIGQAAWSFYQRWMKAYKRAAPSSTTFLSSKYYQSFIRFANHVQRVNLPDPDAFIRLMKEKDISPTIWGYDQVYALYLEYLDRRASPMQQAKITIDTLFKIADAAQCDVSHVFDELHPNEVIDLLRGRRLSPWILLFSSKFKKLLVERTTPEQKIIMESIVRPHYWGEKFQKYPKEVEMMKKYVEELNI